MSDSPPAYLALDLWMAVGLDSQDFCSYYEQNGWADTWSNLLGVCRHLVGRRTCANPVDDTDHCVLREGHIGPCYGADDVGRPNDLLPAVVAKMADGFTP